MRRRALIALLASLLPSLAGAQGTFTPIETPTPLRTVTPIGTVTPIQSFTPVRTLTPIPTSTLPGRTVRPSRTVTATPSSASTPTVTPTPTGATPTGSASPTQSRTPTWTATPLPTPTRFLYCVGDCSGDGVIVVHELILGVLIAQNPAGLPTCSAFDRNGDRLVGIDELVVAVGLALSGCP